MLSEMSSIDWIKTLELIATKVRIRATQVLGSSDAGTVLGRNLSGDLTRDIDMKAEKTILEELQKLRIPIFYIGEEVSSKIGVNPSTFVIADCIDGTLNAITGIPFFCTSIAVSNTRKMSGVFVGLVMDLCRGDVFVATKDRGALMNGKTIRVSGVTELSDSIVRAPVSHLDDVAARRLLTTLSEVRNDRHLGSAALELCYLAAGFYQSFVDIRRRLRPTDLAAAYLIIRESGGIVSFPDGTKFDCILDSKSRLPIVASCNMKLHEKILGSLSS